MLADAPGRASDELLHSVAVLLLFMADHWLTAIPLVLWPELLAAVAILTVRQSGARHEAGWAAWLVIVIAAQGASVWIAAMKGWASSDDLPNVVFSAFVGSLPGAIAGIWFFQFVEDMRDRHKASA